jgi:Ca-activated chloride channel family protein
MLISHKRKIQMRRKFAEDKLIDKNSRSISKRVLWARIAILSSGLIALVIALARPVTENGKVEFPQGTTDVMVIVDVSRSMAACEYQGKLAAPYKNGTRLDMARYLISQEVIPSLGVNRIGIVTYAGDGFPLAFLTNDSSAVDWILKRAMLISSATGDGSSIVNAFVLAFKMFALDSDSSHRKIIVLFSDGGNDDGLDALNALAGELRNQNVELIVVGLGKLAPAPIPMQYLSPNDQYQYGYQMGEFYQVDNEIAYTQLDENALRILANRAGGKYLRVSEGNDFSFDSLSQRLEMRWRKGTKELFFYPLFASAILLTIGWFLAEKITLSWRSSPNKLVEEVDHEG